MNHVDAFVTKILNEPYFRYNVWWLDVEYESWGIKGQTKIFFPAREQADSVRVGYKFLC